MSDSVPARLSASGLTAFLHEMIPLSQAMAATVTELGPGRLVVEAPLPPNRNHLGTAFGGSLHALPTLACYAVLWSLLREAGLDGHVILRRSRAHYRRPVTGGLRAICVRPPAADCAGFLRSLHRHKKAQLDLTARVEGPDGQSAVEFGGDFVAVI